MEQEAKRLIGKLGEMSLFIVVAFFMYQLGQSNAHQVESLIRQYCPPTINYTVNWAGSVVLSTPQPVIAVP